MRERFANFAGKIASVGRTCRSSREGWASCPAFAPSRRGTTNRGHDEEDAFGRMPDAAGETPTLPGKSGLPFKPCHQLFALVLQLLWHYSVERIKEIAMRLQLFLPFSVVDPKKLGHALMIDVETVEIDVVYSGQPTNRRFGSAAAAFTSVDDPLQDAHVIAKARPKKISGLSFAEPVHIKYERRIGQPLSDIDPVPKIVADVVAAERQHRHRIAPNLANCAGSSGRRFRN